MVQRVRYRSKVGKVHVRSEAEQLQIVTGSLT